MGEKAKLAPLSGIKPVPMKLFATWEVDRTPPNCIPRLCSLTLTRLVLLKSLGSEVSSILIAVKMQGSKRTLRSNEIILTPNGLLDTELQLSFSLQYPHFLKRDGNKLHVMLQRRKRYKNRTILGYKTLAEGIINMSQVLQRQREMELDLIGDCKESKAHTVVIGRISVSSLSSQPVDHEDNNKTSDRGVGDFSDEEEFFSSGNDDGEVEGSDSEPMIDDRRRGRKSKINGNVRQRNLKQKFISLLKRFRVNEESLDNDQETISRKLSEVGGDMDAVDIEDLFDELEDLSDSGPEMDTMSVSSTPKPSLRPFFSSSRSLLHDGLNVTGRILHKKNCHALSISTALNKHQERIMDRVSDESSKKADSDSHPENWTDSDPPPNKSPPRITEDKKEYVEKDRKSKLFARDRNNSSNKIKKNGQQYQDGSSGCKPNDLLSPLQSQAQSDIAAQFDNRRCMDQLNRLLPPDDGIPEALCLVNIIDQFGSNLANKLQEKQYKVIALSGLVDTRAVITCLVIRMQKYCNMSSKPPSQLKLLLAGSDSFINTVMRHYIDQLSFKSPDWIMYIKFFIIPLGSSYLCRYLGSLDSVYNTMFATDSWKDCLEKTDSEEAISRVVRYLQQANSFINLPVAEAMLTCKEKSLNEESSQIFIPFIIDVRLGGNIESSLNISSSCMIADDESPSVMSPITVPSSSILTTSSPPSNMADKKIDRPNTPPNSPNINNNNTPASASQYVKELFEPLELQLDYWLMPSKNSEVKADIITKKSDSSKFSLKAAFRSLQIARLTFGELPASNFSITYNTTKEKKQKIMRLGKKKEKDKDYDIKNQVVDGVYRLICSPKAQNVPLIVTIDGNEWTGVKFFQLSAQWQTHVKHFPVTLFNSSLDGTFT